MPILPVLLAASQLMSPPAPSSRTCAAIDVVAPVQRHAKKELRHANKKKSFSAAQTLDLELRTRLRTTRELSGDHVLRLKLFTPRGYLYQEITVPFHRESPSSGKGKKGKSVEPVRVVPGFPQPLSVQRTQRVGKGRQRYDQVSARLPVAGTSITLGSLFGRWTVVPYLDDATAPCGRAQRFVIRK
jgi:hypothetical protein